MLFIPLFKKDKNILKKLALEVRSISERDIEKEKKQKWILHNDLKLKEPLIFCDPENGWNEILTPDIIECEGNVVRYTPEGVAVCFDKECQILSLKCL